jgi:hypothetical protein
LRRSEPIRARRRVGGEGDENRKMGTAKQRNSECAQVRREEFTPGEEVEGKRRNGRMQLKIRPNTECVSLQL